MENINNKRKGLDYPLTIVSLAVLFGFVIYMALRPEEALAGVVTVFNIATTSMGAPLMIFTFVTTILAFYLAFGKYRNIKLGEGKPEYSNFSYIAMMALACLASAALFWSFTEWAYYYMAPGLLMEPFTAAAAEISLGYAFFHWGFATQGPYVLIGGAIAYAVYNRGVKFFKVSAVCEDMMGDFKFKKILCKIIDITVIFCIIGALATTLGLAVPLMTGGIEQVFGLEDTFAVQVASVIGIGLVFTFTSFLGTKKGMQYLSNGATALCLVLLLIILLAGPTMFIIKNFVSSLGWMGSEYIRMSFFTDVVDPSGFPEGWTYFFQAFALTYTAMMGIFVAKISKGRTLKELSLCCMLGVSGGVMVLFGINGGFALDAELSGELSVTGILSEGAGQDMIYALVETLPGGSLILPALMLLIIIGFVSSSLDSASLALAQTTTSALDEKGDVSRWLRVFWCFVLTALPLVIMYVEAPFDALKNLAIIVSLPFMLVAIFMEIVFFRWLREHKAKEDAIMKAKLDKLDDM